MRTAATRGVYHFPYFTNEPTRLPSTEKLSNLRMVTQLISGTVRLGIQTLGCKSQALFAVGSGRHENSGWGDGESGFWCLCLDWSPWQFFSSLFLHLSHSVTQFSLNLLVKFSF